MERLQSYHHSAKLISKDAFRKIQGNFGSKSSTTFVSAKGKIKCLLQVSNFFTNHAHLCHALFLTICRESISPAKLTTKSNVHILRSIYD